MTSTAAAVAKVLADAGIERVFGLPGGEVLVLIDELRRAGVDFVLMRHEANAGIAAAVYGKLRGQPGVVLTTLGPGAANLMLPLCSAYLDQEPLLAISAQIPDGFPASHTHQLLPLHDAYRPVARYVDKITGSNVFDVVPRALRQCMERPFGASYLTLSAREALVASVGGQGSGLGVQSSRTQNTEQPSRNAPEQASALAAALAGAKQPLVVAGLEIVDARADRHDFPGRLAPKRSRIAWVHAQGVEHVAEVHAGRVDPDPDVAGRQFTRFERGHHERVDAAPLPYLLSPRPIW